ncbi:VOC family protein, partial [Amycolatopsis thermoflava]|uniref:VOC family protein n=1 Tax=Amycolatopsis thermoflava TaxID=84480 RepID=UPI00364C114A
LLRSVHTEDLGLMLREVDAASGDHPIFSLSVANASAEFERLKALKFEEGVGLVGSELMEWPLGRTFTVNDPSGNRFTIDEWRYSKPRQLRTCWSEGPA